MAEENEKSTQKMNWSLELDGLELLQKLLEYTIEEIDTCAHSHTGFKRAVLFRIVNKIELDYHTAGEQISRIVTWKYGMSKLLIVSNVLFIKAHTKF